MAHSIDNGAMAAANPKLGTIFTKLVRELKYQTPQHDDTRPALEAAMLEYAASSGAPYESEYAQRYFDVGLTLACVCLLPPSMTPALSAQGTTDTQSHTTNFACQGLLSISPLCRETAHSHLLLAGHLHRR